MKDGGFQSNGVLDVVASTMTFVLGGVSGVGVAVVVTARRRPRRVICIGFIHRVMFNLENTKLK